MTVGSGGLRASVVRMVEYRNEEFLDRHPSSRASAAKRPFLLVLSPDSLLFSSSGDAKDDSAASSILALASRKRPEQRPPRPGVGKPLALLHKLANSTHTGSGASDGASESGDAAAAAAGDCGDSRTGLLDDGGGPLQEGQLLTFQIALSQVVAVEAGERRIKVLYGRQRPHRSTEEKDDWKALAKAAALPLALPWEALKHKDWSVEGYLNRHRRDPFVSSVTFEADSPQEAEALGAAIQQAIARLGQAVSWIARDLPLLDRPVITLVTAAAGPPGSTAGGAGSASTADLAQAAAAAPGAPGEAIICTFPRLRAPLDVPAPAAPADGLAAGAPAELAVHVWLHSPLGPAVATLTEQQLRQSANAGGAPLSVLARPPPGYDAPAAPASGGEKLQVVLQFSASLPVARSPIRWVSLGDGAASAAAAAGGGGVRLSGGGIAPVLSLLAVPLLSAWLQLLHGGSDATTVLQSVAFLVCSLAAITGIVVLQLARMRASVAASSATAAAAQAAVPTPVHAWRLTLLSADLVSETRRQAGAPCVQRVVSSSLPTAPSGLPMPAGATTVELPAPIRRLVVAHPGLLSDDIAARYLVLGRDKAYQAIKNMVEWVEAQGMADLLHQAQPQFEAIRRAYCQVFYSWSTRADCVLEIEHTGRWREAYDALRAQGVTEADMLRYLFFEMEYTFRVLDPRPLPAGKTVKIIDLEGLSMKDVGSAAFKWYLQVGGALLAVNYPQRLHKAFLLNAPTWSGVLWKVLAAVIPRRTREHLVLFTKKQQEAAAEALLEWVPADQLPAKYGGSCTVPLQESQLEHELRAYVRRLNDGAARQAAQAAALEGGAGAVGGAAALGERTP